MMAIILAAAFAGSGALTFALQLAALIALLVATLGKSAVWDGKIQTLPLGLFFWLLSLMLTAALHTAGGP